MKFFLIVLILIATLGIGYYWIKSPSKIAFTNNNIPNKFFVDYRVEEKYIGGEKYFLYIADTPQKREKGLSLSPFLVNNAGMIFYFDSKDYYSFWMKNMQYPIDIIFLDDTIIIDIFEKVQPESYPETFTAKKVANIVIELNAEDVKKNNLSIGDNIY